MLNEFIDFLRFEKEYGLKIVIKDIFLINKLYLKKVYVKKILDFADKNKLKFTFFITAKNLEKKKDIINRMLNEGHEISSHGYNHILLDRRPYMEIYKEFKKADYEFKKYGIEVKGFRPPFLSVNKDVIAIAKHFGFEYISAKVGGKKFRYKNKIIEVPIIKPYDWQGLVVKKLTMNELTQIWKKQKGTYLLHPYIIEKYLDQLENFFGKNKDLRIYPNLSKDKNCVSIDLY